ncbi:MAG: hypothetical protein AAF653_13325, partial [Chloroflexota bacterium]
MMRGIFKWLGRPTHLASVLLALVPFTYLIYFIQQHWLNVPRADSLRASSVVFKSAAGTLTPADVYGAYFGHITIPSYLLSLASLHWLDWNLKFEISINFALATVTFVLLMFLVWRTSHEVFPYVLVPSAVLYFSVHQNLNWIIAYHGVWFQVQFFILVGAVCIISLPNRAVALGIALVAVAIATFTVGSGVVGWGVLLLGTKIGGQLICSGGKFRNENGTALNAEGA